MAETYHVYDWRLLPVHTVAVLASGLRDYSRTKMKLGGVKITAEMRIIADMADRLRELVWFQTKDGIKHRNRPSSFVEALNGKSNENKIKPAVFDSPEKFREAWKRITERR